MNVGLNTDLCKKYSLKPKWRKLSSAGEQSSEKFLKVPQNWKSFLFPPAKVEGPRNTQALGRDPIRPWLGVEFH